MDIAGHFLLVRSVVGRSTDLYRGVNADPSMPRDPSPGCALTVLFDTLRKLDGISVTRADGRIVLARGDDEEELKIHVDEDLATLPDLNFEGNMELAIRALHALLPFFGAVEIRDGAYTELVDDSEPLEEALRRCQAKAQADRAKIRAAVGAFGHVDDHVDRPPVRRGRRTLTIAIVVSVAVIVPLVGLWVFRMATRGEDVGAKCTKSRQCESGECLSADALTPNPQDDGSPMMRAHERIERGVCTQPCRDDSECPKTMTCQTAFMESSPRAQPFEVKRCTPLDWSAPSE